MSKFESLSHVPDAAIVDHYRSTRGGPDADFWDSVTTGKDSAGGLLMPNEYPKLPKEFMERLPDMEPAEISAYIARHHIPREAIGDEDLQEMMKKAHNFGFPLEFIDFNTCVLRLDQGPTASFKDVAGRELRQLMEAHCEKSGKRVNLIVATSGDTGVAIMNAFGGSEYISVSVMYPTDGVSEMQEKQMLSTAIEFDTTQVIPINGNFDNCQDISILLQAIKNLEKLDDEKKLEARADIIEQARLKLGQTLSEKEVDELGKIMKPLELGSANSQNIWRLIPQMTQYFVGIGEAIKYEDLKPNEKVVFSVPSGNVGHLTAGILAKKLGAPIKKFVAGTNANNILEGLINRGEIRHPGFQSTAAPSMDIGDPNNFERILDFAATETGSNADIDYKRMKDDITKLDKKITKLRKKLDEMEKLGANPDEVDDQRTELTMALTETIQLSEYGVKQEVLDHLRKLIHVEDIVTDEEMFAGIARTEQETDVVMEPHGITAKIAAERARAKGVIGTKDKVIIFETAHPDKFPEALEKSTPEDREYKKHPELEKLKGLNIADLKKPEAVEKSVIVVAKLVRRLADRLFKESA